MAARDWSRRPITLATRRVVLARDGYICGYCPELRRRKPSSLVVDHIIPLRP